MSVYIARAVGEEHYRSAPNGSSVLAKVKDFFVFQSNSTDFIMCWVITTPVTPTANVAVKKLYFDFCITAANDIIEADTNSWNNIASKTFRSPTASVAAATTWKIVYDSTDADPVVFSDFSVSGAITSILVDFSAVSDINSTRMYLMTKMTNPNRLANRISGTFGSLGITCMSHTTIPSSATTFSSLTYSTVEALYTNTGNYGVTFSGTDTSKFETGVGTARDTSLCVTSVSPIAGRLALIASTSKFMDEQNIDGVDD